MTAAKREPRPRRRAATIALAAIAALAASLALGACGDDDEPGGNDVARGCSEELPDSSGWSGNAPIDPETGEVDVEAFNEYLAEAEPPVSTSPCDAARVFARIDAQGDPEQGGATVEVEPEDSAEATATIVTEGLQDDSIEAQRWTLEFGPAEGDRIELRSGLVEYRCHEGRGQQDFATDLCL